ncbi:MAG: prolyl 4-hydroxylase [Myxococcota bacterium]|jgi:prolyl 4-hydroxylase
MESLVDWIVALIAVVVVLIAAALAWFGVQRERRTRFCVREVPEFLSAEECDLIIQLSKPLLKTATIQTSSGVREHSGRKAKVAFVEQTRDKRIRKIRRRIAELAELPDENHSPLQAIRYQVGDHYVAHVDYVAGTVEKLGPEGDRLRSVLIYLNDDFDGGQTLFSKIGLAVQPERGKAIVFDSLDSDGRPKPLSRHAGLAVLKGEKWVVNVLFHERALSQTGNRAQRRSSTERHSLRYRSIH